MKKKINSHRPHMACPNGAHMPMPPMGSLWVSRVLRAGCAAHHTLLVGLQAAENRLFLLPGTLLPHTASPLCAQGAMLRASKLAVLIYWRVVTLFKWVQECKNAKSNCIPPGP